jgi:hypothetical protein
MKRTILSAASVAALLSAVLLASPAFSQSQMRESVKTQLAQNQITLANFDVLSDSQVMQIELILGTSDNAATKQAQVAHLLADPIECAGNAQMRAQVAAGLSQKGVTVPNLDMITGTQLVILLSILNSDLSNAETAAQVTRVFASDSPIVGSEQLRADAQACLGVVNAKVDLGALTPAEMVEVQLIVGGDGDAAAKRAAIEALAK